MGIKNPKGTVSVEKYRSRIRLRWRYMDKRYSVSLFQYSKTNFREAKRIAVQIEQDILLQTFDSSLNKYKGLPEQAEQAQQEKSFVQLFEEWTTVYKQMDCEKHTNYNSVQNMIRKWGEVNASNIHLKLNSEVFCAGTYNRRLTMLKGFIKWLVKARIWQFNPLEDINPKRVKKAKQAKRKPFTLQEISKILKAFKDDTFCSRFSTSKHSHYYPFVYFIFKTGVRNAEAIGLRVGSINLKEKTIVIKEVLARSLKGSSSIQRIRKETKNGKERLLPLTPDLMQVLQSHIRGKNPDDLVFQSPTGVAIDAIIFSAGYLKLY